MKKHPTDLINRHFITMLAVFMSGSGKSLYQIENK